MGGSSAGDCGSVEQQHSSEVDRPVAEYLGGVDRGCRGAQRVGAVLMEMEWPSALSVLPDEVVAVIDQLAGE